MKNFLRFSQNACLMFGLILLTNVTIFAAPGDLDITFGSSGKVVTQISIDRNLASEIAIQPDGKIVVVGRSYTNDISKFDVVVVRYT